MTQFKIGDWVTVDPSDLFKSNAKKGAGIISKVPDNEILKDWYTISWPYYTNCYKKLLPATTEEIEKAMKDFAIIPTLASKIKYGPVSNIRYSSVLLTREVFIKIGYEADWIKDEDINVSKLH